MRQRLLTSATCALILVAGTLGSATAAWKAQTSYYASSAVTGAREPINLIVASRVQSGLTSGIVQVIDAYESLGDEGGPYWFNNNTCNDLTMGFNGSGQIHSMSTDDGTAFDKGGFSHCGDGERNHWRAWMETDQVVGGVSARDNVYMAASLEQIYGQPTFDNANNAVGNCPTSLMHCLTRQSFNWGRDGYGLVGTDRSAWTDLAVGWSRTHGHAAYGYLTTLNPAPTDWIWQGLAWFKSDGKAAILEDAYDITAWSADPGTVSASSTYLTFTPNRAFDGTSNFNEFTNSSRWQSSGTAPQWLRIDLLANNPGFPYDTAQVVSGTWNTTTGLYDNTLRSFRIQVSDNLLSWTTVGTVSNLPDHNGVVMVNVGSRSNRYVRLYVDAVNGGGRASVFTLKLLRRP